MQTIENGHTLLSPGEGELIEAAGNPSQLRWQAPASSFVTTAPRRAFPARRCTSIPGSTRPISCWEADWR